MVAAQSLTAAVMSWSLLAATCSAMPPPPHDWKRSGMLFEARSALSLSLNAWFSRTVILMVTFGCAATYASAIDWKSGLPMSSVEMCHQLMVTLAAGAAVVAAGAAVVATGAWDGAWEAGAVVGVAAVEEHAPATSANDATPARSRL